MTLDELRRELAEGVLRPAYLLAGAEPLLRDEALAALRAAALGDGPADFDSDRLEGEQTGAAALSDALRALPVLAPHRLVWLREPEARKRAGGCAESLPERLEELAGQRATVLVVTAARIDRRSRWVKAFREPAAFVSCDPPRPGRELVAFVKAEAKRLGIALEAGAAEALADATGPQLLLLRSELEKASLLAGPGEKVLRRHVSEGAVDVFDEPVWDLTDAIGEGRAGDALLLLQRLLASGAAPPMLLGTLASHFRKLTRARHGETPTGHPFAVRKLERQAQRYPAARLLACLSAIHEVDCMLKGQGALPPELALERLVMGLSA